MKRCKWWQFWLFKIKKTYDNSIDRFVDRVQFDFLEGLCATVDIPYEPPAADDDWPDWEDNLRGKIADAMQKVSEQ